jgi:hypothetical protein
LHPARRRLILVVRHMSDHVATRIWSHARSALYVLVGLSLVSIAISFLDYVQGIVLSNWSGVHPIYRLLMAPIRILLSSGAGLVVAAIAYFSRYAALKTRKKQILFGAACGTVTIGSLLTPWVPNSNSDVLFFIVFAITLPFIFWLRVHLSKKNDA